MVSQTLDATFHALADPTRRAILARLVEGERSVSELAEPFDLAMPSISKHLKVLEHAGLVERSRRAQWRPVRLRAKPLAEASDWIEQYRAIWEDNFAKLDTVLETLRTGGKRVPPRTEKEPDGETRTRSRRPRRS